MRTYILIPILLIVGALFVSFKRKIIPSEKKKFASSYKLRGCDVHGCGYFGAPRGNRTHKGIDPVAYKGDPIPSPFNGIVKRYGRTYSTDVKDTLVEIEGTGIFKGYKAKLMHVHPTTPVGYHVNQGDSVAIAEGIEDVFAGITPHYHLEIYDPNGNIQNPEDYI